MENIILNAAGISKTYHAGSVDVEALKKSNVLFKKGEFTAIVGKSGSGKSTLLRIIGTMDRPDEGTVEIEGMNVFEMKDKQLSKFRREKIGFIYQDYSLFPEFTAYENIVVPFALDNKNAPEEEIDGILESLGISHCKGKYPSQMSGGEHIIIVGASDELIAQVPVHLRERVLFYSQAEIPFILTTIHLDFICYSINEGNILCPSF